jgi:hypothetical protein
MNIQVMNLLIKQSSSVSYHFLPLRSKYSSQHPVLNLCSSLSVGDQVSHPYKTIDKIIVLYILIFKVLERSLEAKHSEWNGSKHSMNLFSC